MHLTPNSCVVSLLKMLTYSLCMLRFFVGSRPVLGHNPLFLRWVLVFYTQQGQHLLMDPAVGDQDFFLIN